jgi:perosamine synthetase
MTDLGYNYRLTDFQSALGISQLKRLQEWVEIRQRIAGEYNAAFADVPAITPLHTASNLSHAHHLYVVQLDPSKLNCDRKEVFAALRAEGIGVNVHYIPVHLHPYYRARFGTKTGMCPVAESAYQRILSLPIFPSMSNDDIQDVIEAVKKVVSAYLDCGDS